MTALYSIAVDVSTNTVVVMLAICATVSWLGWVSLKRPKEKG